MSETNFDSKLQKTISTMHVIGDLASEAEAQTQACQDDFLTKELIVSLKQGILNQSEFNVIDAQNKFDNPPMTIVEVEGKKVELIDEKILKELKESLESSKINFENSKLYYEDAKINSTMAKSQVSERDLAKSILEEELNNLSNQTSALLEIVQSESKSALKTMEKNKDINKGLRDDKLNLKNHSSSSLTEDQSPYFKLNLHIKEFKKVLDTGANITSHMSIEAVDDN